MHKFHLGWLLPSPLVSPSVQRKHLLGHTEPWGCCPGLKRLKMFRLDGTCTWKCGAETKQTHSTGCWAKQGSVWLPAVLQCCPRPSLLAPRSLPALISVSEAGLELPEQKCPCWATLVLPEMCPKGTLLQPQATSRSWHCVCAHRADPGMCHVWHRTTGIPSPSPVLPHSSHTISPPTLPWPCWRLFVLMSLSLP